jgi:PAS domain S-box-containing protein
MRWADDITSSFSRTLRASHPASELHIEYMDTKRVLDQRHLDNLLETYRHKFRNKNFALIVTADDAALRFAMQHRKELFPGVPLVFCGVNNLPASMLDGQRDVTGILEEVDIADTLETALKLHPDTKRVFIVNDQSESGKGLRHKIDKAILPFSNRIKFIFLEDYTVEELSKLEQKLPGDSIMLRSAFFIDKEGHILPDEVASLGAIGGHASVPVYSLWDFFMGLGIVGGKLVSGAAQGEAAALMAGRILEGVPPSEIPLLTESPNRYMFDYIQMQRFSINKESLPEGSIIVNGPEPFYAVDKPLLWLGGVFTITVTFTSLLLFFAVRRRKRAETLLRSSRDRLLEQQVTLAGLTKSDVFSNADMDKAIRYLLDVAAWQLSIVRSSLWLFSADGSYLRCIDLYELGSDTHCCALDLKGADYPSYFSAITTGELIVANNAKDHPLLRELPLNPEDIAITARLDVPIHIQNKPAGVLSLEHCGKKVEWSAEQRFFAMAMANLVALVIEQHQRRMAEQLVLHAHAKFQDLFNSAGDAIIIHDLNGRMMEVNQKMCDRLGYRHDELIDMTLTQITAPEKAQFIAQRIDAAKSGDRVLYETEHQRKDGTTVPVEVNSIVIDFDGAPAIMSVIRNITGRKEMERIKDEMLSAVSHEMRTPLTTIIGYTSFMMETISESHEHGEYLRTIYSATRRLEELINNFLDLQRLKADQGQLKSASPLPLPILLEETAQLYAMSSTVHTLRVEYPPDLPPVLGDGQQLLQVFSNLTSNAFKYSPDGGEINISAEQEGDTIVVQVKDHGIGIPPEAQELIFDRFYRVDNSDRRQFGGIGLGLSLVKQIVDLHHGQIRVESTPGTGSTFFVTLPIAMESVAAEDIY